MFRRVIAIYLLALAAPGLSQDGVTLMTARDLMAVKVKSPDHVIRCGPAPSQFDELRLPAGNGPHPVVVLVHGGCWSAYAGTASIAAMADAL